MDKLTGYASIDQPWLKHYPNGVYMDIVSNINTSMYNFMCEKNKDYLDGTALKYFKDDFSYGFMLKKIDEFARILTGYGITAGDVVSVCMPNVPETVYLIYAINKIGAVANMIEPRQSTANIAYFVNNSNSKLLFSFLDICPTKIQPIMNQLKVENVVYLTLSQSFDKTKNSDFAKSVLKSENTILDMINGDKKIISLDDIYKKYATNGSINSFYSEDVPATIVYTSGTTGNPKGAMLPSKAYNCMHNQLQYVADFKRGETFLGALPFFSAYGSSCGLHNSVCSGQPIILVPKFNPNLVPELIMNYKPNVAFLVPNYWDSLSTSPKAQDADFSYLHICVAGGDKYPVANLERTNAFLNSHNSDQRIRVGYGETEVNGAAAVMPENPDFYVPGSAGVILPGCKCIVINRETGLECKYGENGEICFSSPTMMLGYNNKPESTEELTIIFKGEKYYRTGDEGFINEDGIVTVVDRYKRSIMRPDGHTVHASPIEEALLAVKTPDGKKIIDECCVVGIKKNNKLGSIPTAFIKLNDEFTMSEDLARAIDGYCLTILSERERAFIYCIVDKIPYNSNGKVDYKEFEKIPFESLEQKGIIVLDEQIVYGELPKEKKNSVLVIKSIN